MEAATTQPLYLQVYKDLRGPFLPKTCNCELTVQQAKKTKKDNMDVVIQRGFAFSMPCRANGWFKLLTRYHINPRGCDSFLKSRKNP